VFRIIVSGCKAVSEAVGICVKGTNKTVTGCYVPVVSQQAYFVTGSSRCTLTGNTAYGSGGEAIWLNNNSNYNSIRGNTFCDCDATNTSWNSIHLSNTSIYNTITGNVIDGNNHPTYGIKEAASADDHNLIVANIVRNFATGTISNAGASSVSANNMTS
jgi:parallel beta-helix repeat protein